MTTSPTIVYLLNLKIIIISNKSNADTYLFMTFEKQKLSPSKKLGFNKVKQKIIYVITKF